MCGVCGIIPLGSRVHVTRTEARVAGMMRALAHRGPDDSGVATSDVAVVGATRLAIRGLHSGKQPIVHHFSGVVVVCNGEIDNHREIRKWLAERGRTVELETDIAVIADLYLELGEKFVEQLTGVFAIGLWDPRKQRLLLVRDRAGERPLFFSAEDDVVRFATEIAALASDDGSLFKPSAHAVHEYLRLGCFVSPITPFAEIEKVAPGEIISVSAGAVARRRYWRWNVRNAVKKPPDAEAFDDVFRTAVWRQTEVDVPYGVFLSGGLDSSLIAAVARDLRPDQPLTAYSVRFREASYDEGSFAEEVAHALGLKSVSVWVEAKAFPEALTELINCVGEPLADPAWIPTALLARRAAQDVKLALAGEGGDELFGGYPTYLAAQVAQRYASLPGFLRSALRKVIKAWPQSDRKVTLSYLLKKFVEGTQADGLARHLFWKASASPAVLSRLGVCENSPPSTDYKPHELLDALQQIDLETSLAEGLLTKADRATMASALEVRTPFLDQAVMEFAATLPVPQRVHGFTTKYFLKEYALRYLPGRIIHRRKRGLSVPLTQWLRGPLHDWARSRLNTDLLGEVGVNRQAALELFDDHCLGKADHSRVIWALVVLVEWLTWRNKL